MEWNLFFEVSHYFPRHKYRCVQKNDDDDETLDENAIEKRENKVQPFCSREKIRGLFSKCNPNTVVDTLICEKFN